MLLRRDRILTAVSIVLDVAFYAGRAATVSGSEIADRMGEARRGIEPVLQLLSKAGILASMRGPKGGYRLGRAARAISLAEIVGVIQAEPAEGEAVPAEPSPLTAAVTLPLWKEVEAGLLDSLAELTVADLLSRASAQGLRRPTPEPLNFAI